MKLLTTSIASLQIAAFGSLIFFGISFRPLLLASPVLQPSLDEYQSLHRGVWLSTVAVVALTALAVWIHAQSSASPTTVGRTRALLVVAPTVGLLSFWLWLQHGTSW